MDRRFGIGERAERAIIPDAAPRQADRPEAPAPAERSHDATATRQGGGDLDEDQRAQLPRHRHHHVPTERRQAGNRASPPAPERIAC